MNRISLQDMTAAQLVARFLAIALQEYDALQGENHTRFNRLFDERIAVMAEFMLCPIEQRCAVMALYKHSNPQVRYAAASATRDFAPREARRVCEIISERNEYPQAANARLLIRALDEGDTDMSWVLDRRKGRLP